MKTFKYLSIYINLGRNVVKVSEQELVWMEPNLSATCFGAPLLLLLLLLCAGTTWAPAVPWTGPPTIALLDLVATTKAANAEGAFEGQFDTVLAALDFAGLTTLLEGQALMTVRFFIPSSLFVQIFLCFGPLLLLVLRRI